MADTYDFSLDFAYDDVTKGLYDITQHGKQVLDVFLKMADQIAASTTKMGKAGKEAIDPLSAIGKAADQVFKGINTNLEAMERQVRQIDMTSLEKSADKYGERIKVAQAELAKMYLAAQNINASDEERLKLSNKIADAQAQILSMQKAQGQITALADQAKQQKQAAEQAKADAKDLAAQQKQAAEQAKADAKELAAIQRQVDAESKARLKELAAEEKAQNKANLDALKAIEAQEKNAAAAAKEFAESQKALHETMLSAFGNLRNAAVGIAASLSVGIGASGKSFMDLSDQMATFKAVAHASGEEVDYMVQKAKGLEGIPTQQAAAAAIELARAGINAKEAADDLGILSQAAIASGESLDSVSTIMLSTNRAFGLANGELKNTTDIITAAANATSTSVAEVGSGMSQMASASHATGQTLLATATAFGILRDAGVSVESAATGYKNVMLTFASPSEKARKELNLLTGSANGVKEVFQDNGKIRAFADVMADLKERLSGLSEAARTDALAKIFDKRALNVVLAYMGQTDEKIQSTRAEIEKFSGTAKDTADIMKESLGYSFRDFQKDAENLKSSLGERMAPTLKTLIDFLDRLVNAYDNLSGPLKTVVADGVLAAAGMSALVGFAAQLVIAVGGAKLAWDAFTAAQVRARAAQLANAEAAGIAEGAIVAQGEAAGAATLAGGGLFLLLGGITAIVAEVWVAVDAFNKWQKAVEDMDGAISNMKDYEARSAGGVNAALSKPASQLTDDDIKKAELDDQVQSNKRRKAMEDLQQLRDLQKRFNQESRVEIKTALDQQMIALMDELKMQGILKGELSAKNFMGIAIRNDIPDADLKGLIDGLKSQGGRTGSDSTLLSSLASTVRGSKSDKGSAAGLTDADLEAADDNAKKAADKADKAAAAEVSRYVTEQKRITDAKIAADKEQISRQMSEQAKHSAGTARNTYETFLGNQPISRIRGVGGKHAGVDLQAQADYDKPYGSMVYAPENVRVTGVNPSLPYGAEVMLQSLVDKHVSYILHHLSPGDARNNIKVGQEFDQGNPLGARVGGNAEIKQGPHWQGVHLHVEKYIDGKLSSIENDMSKTSSLGGSKQALEDKKKELEYQKSIVRQQEMLNALKTKEAEIAAKFGTDSKAYAAIHGAVMDAETKLTDLRTKSTEASEKARKDRVSAEQKANEEIARLREAHQAAQIALMEEGEDKIKAQREAELQANANDLKKALSDFNGTQKQKEAILAGYAQKDLDTNARWDKARLELKDKLAKESREFDDKIEQGRIDAMAEGLPKQQALIQFELKKQLDAYDDQEKELIKRKLEKSQQFKDIEILRTQAVAEASKKRATSELQDMAATAQARKDFLEAMVSDEQKAFESSLQNLIASKKKVGIGLSNVAGSLKSEEVAGLAQSLGQDSAGSLLANLKEQVRAIEDANKAEEGLQANRDKGSAEYKRQQNAINAAKKEQTELEKMIAVLSDKGLQDQVGKYQEVLKKIQAINEEHQRFQGLLQGVTTVAQGFASSFGDVGRNIASGIGVASNAISSIENLMTNFKAMPDGKNSISDFFGDIKNVKDVVGLITTGVGLVGQFVMGLIQGTEETRKAIKAAADAKINYNTSLSLSASQRVIDDMKRNGQDTTQLELAQADAVAASSIARLKQQEVTVNYSEAKGPLQRRQQVTGNFDPAFAEKALNSGISQSPELIAKLQEYNQILDNQAKTKADIQKAAQDKRLQERQAYESKAVELQVLTAKAGTDKLAMVDAEAAANKLAIQHKYDAEFKDAAEKGIVDQSNIQQRFFAEMAAAEKDAAQKRRDQLAENDKFEIDVLAKHEEAKIGLMQEGYQKDRALAILQRDINQRNLAAEMSRYEEGSKERKALSQQMADALISDNERIRKSDEANALARTKDLNAMRAATAQALAAMTESGLDDIAAQRQSTLADLVVAEGEERKKAIANYGEDQEILNGISAKYAALRAKNNRDTEKQALESARKDYETMKQQILTGQLHPLQMILDKENDRVRTLQRANEELQHSLDLIDKRYAKENKAQDLADRAQFDALKGGGISLADLTAGANEIANEDIINGKVTDRSSKATQLRGLKLLLARQAQDAETKRKNEGYDSTNSDLNEQGFASDMARILGRQAAVVEAAKAEAKSAKEKSDLDAEGADLYVKYQQLQKDALAAKQRAEQQGIRDQMDANSALIDQGWDTVTQTKRQMEDLQTAYDVKMKGVSDAFMVAGNSSDVLLAKLKQWAPALAASAQAAVASIKTVTNALNTSIPTVGGSSSGAYSGPSRVSTPTPGYIVTDGTYWYKNTSDMYAASATHMASGGVVPSGFEGDNFPALLKTGERVLPAAFNSRLENMLQHFSSLPLPSTNHYGGNSIGDIYISRDVDLSKLEAILDQRDFRKRGQNMGRYGGTGLSRN